MTRKGQYLTISESVYLFICSSVDFKLLRNQDLDMGSESNAPASMMKLDLDTGSQGQGCLLIA